MKTTLYMLRHGFSVSNDLKYFTGNLDVPLTETGRRQAEKAAEYFKNIKIDRIYASDLCRAYETVLPVGEALSLPVIKDEGLREIFAGEWEGVYFDELNVKYAQSYSVWRNDIGSAACDGGETVKAFSERILKTVKAICDRHPGETILIATHATPIRVLQTVSQNLPIEKMAAVPWVKNASINVFGYEDGVFTLIDKDITDHLGDMKTALPTNV